MKAKYTLALETLVLILFSFSCCKEKKEEPQKKKEQVLYDQMMIDLDDLSVTEGWDIEKTKAQIIEEKIGEKEVVITHLFSKVCASRLDTAYIISIKDFYFNDEVGLPSILIGRFRRDIPEGISASVELLESSYVDFDIPLAPAEGPSCDFLPIQEKERDHIPIVVGVEPIEPYKGYYPKSILESESYYSRFSSCLTIFIYPLQYNYEKKQVRLYKKIKYKVTFSDKVDKIIF